MGGHSNSTNWKNRLSVSGLPLGALKKVFFEIVSGYRGRVSKSSEPKRILEGNTIIGSIFEDTTVLIGTNGSSVFGHKQRIIAFSDAPSV